MTTLKVSSPAELLSVVPFLVGFHPVDSLIVVAMHGPRITFAVRIDLPEHDTPEEEAKAAVLHLATVVMQQAAEAVTIIGYGEEPRVTPAVLRISDAFEKARVTIVDELRVTDERYWSYLCEDLSCCPPEGQPCEPAFSVVATEATYAGAVALPSREALVAQLKAVTGDDREAMTAATARAMLRLAALASERPPAPDQPADETSSGPLPAADPQHDQKAPYVVAATAAASHSGLVEQHLSNVIWASLGVAAPVPDEPPLPEQPEEAEPAPKSTELLSDEDYFFAQVRRAGRTAVQAAERCYSVGGRLTDDDAAWLGVLLVNLAVRDYAWTRTRTHEWELAMWSDLTRRVEPRYVPAPASLLAFVAWRMGLGPLANIAVERALDKKPDYSLANLVEGALIIGLSPSVLDGWPAVDGMPSLDDYLDSEGDSRPDVPVHFRPKTVTNPVEPAEQEEPDAAELGERTKAEPDEQVATNEESLDGAEADGTDRNELEGSKQKSRDGTDADLNRPGQLPVRLRSDIAPADPRGEPGHGPRRRDKRPHKSRRRV